MAVIARTPHCIVFRMCAWRAPFEVEFHVRQMKPSEAVLAWVGRVPPLRIGLEWLAEESSLDAQRFLARGFLERYRRRYRGLLAPGGLLPSDAFGF